MESSGSTGSIISLLSENSSPKESPVPSRKNSLTKQDPHKRKHSLAPSSRSSSFEFWEKFAEHDLQIPRSEWIPRILQKHTDVLETRERLRFQLDNKESFGRAVDSSSTTEAKESLPPEAVLQLIDQFFLEEGLEKTRQQLQAEMQEDSLSIVSEYEDGALVSLLQIGTKDIKDYFGALPVPEDEEDEEVEALEEFIEYEINSDEGNPLQDGIGVNQGVESESEPKEVSVEEDSIIMKDKKVHAASLHRAILYLLQRSDREFKVVFFNSYPSFTTAEKLLGKFFQLYTPAQPQSPPIDASRISSVIREWIDLYPFDWSEKLVSLLDNWIDSVLIRDKHLNLAKQLKSSLARLESLQSKERKLERCPDPKIPKNIFSPTLSLDDIDEEEIARQLTIIDYNLYEKIKPSELLSKNWSSAQLKYKCTNLNNFLSRFNELSRWVATLILGDQRGKNRLKQLERLLDIAKYLFALRNFNSLMAIYSGLLSSPVVKVLQSMWQELPKGYQELIADLQTLFSPDNCYQTYRTQLQNSPHPCIPYLGIHLRDIAMLDDLLPNTVQNLINFDKKRRIVKVILNCLKYQSTIYNFYYIHQIAVLLKNFKLLSEKELYEKSLILELSAAHSSST